MEDSRITGKKLNEIWGVNAEHALYREDGKWYHHLTKFPGALFDKDGYVIFNNEDEYINCGHLQHGKDIHVPKGIAKIPGYIKISD